jgi:ribosomal protein S18 acetylase RimI-like enzyme
MIRRATVEDIDKILSIVRSAQLSLHELGIDQWQDGYPRRGNIALDIANGIGWVVVDEDNSAIGYAAIPLTGEEAYKQLPDEAWHTNERYVVVHRLCVDGTLRRQGIAMQLMSHAMELAHANGMDGFRIDTHRGNIRMLALVEKLGFQYCGIVRYDSGERLAFDLNIK